MLLYTQPATGRKKIVLIILFICLYSVIGFVFLNYVRYNLRQKELMKMKNLEIRGYKGRSVLTGNPEEDYKEASKKVVTSNDLEANISEFGKIKLEQFNRIASEITERPLKEDSVLAFKTSRNQYEFSLKEIEDYQKGNGSRNCKIRINQINNGVELEALIYFPGDKPKIEVTNNIFSFCQECNIYTVTSLCLQNIDIDMFSIEMIYYIAPILRTLFLIDIDIPVTILLAFFHSFRTAEITFMLKTSIKKSEEISSVKTICRTIKKIYFLLVDDKTIVQDFFESIHAPNLTHITFYNAYLTAHDFSFFSSIESLKSVQLIDITLLNTTNYSFINSLTGIEYFVFINIHLDKAHTEMLQKKDKFILEIKPKNISLGYTEYLQIDSRGYDNGKTTHVSIFFSHYQDKLSDGSIEFILKPENELVEIFLKDLNSKENLLERVSVIPPPFSTRSTLYAISLLTDKNISSSENITISTNLLNMFSKNSNIKMLQILYTADNINLYVEDICSFMDAHKKLRAYILFNVNFMLKDKENPNQIIIFRRKTELYNLINIRFLLKNENNLAQNIQELTKITGDNNFFVFSQNENESTINGLI